MKEAQLIYRSVEFLKIDYTSTIPKLCIVAYWRKSSMDNTVTTEIGIVYLFFVLIYFRQADYK